MTEKDPRWTGWRAVIRPTYAGTFGIYWLDAPAMEARGGYSGPYRTREEAEDGALDWLRHFDLAPEDYTITHEENPA